MKVGKPTSKRTPVRLRHKIEKASAAKQRKQRKLAKKNPEWRTRLKKDPGIPNLFPHKDKILAEIEERKRLKEEEALRRREEAKASKSERSVVSDQMLDSKGAVDEDEDEALLDLDDEPVDDASQDDSNPMAALLASARARAVDYNHKAHIDDAMEEDSENEDSWDGFDEEEASSRTVPTGKADPSRRAFTSVLNELLSSADVLLYVLDARDPPGTRSREIEGQIMAADGGSKRMILILNKIDLVPPRVLKAWLVHLRRYFPTLPLRASNSAANAKTWDHKSLTVKATSETLIKALKSYSAKQGMKGTVRVGIIGYPNVGKSSVINALRARLGSRNDACPVGAEAGVTTSLREVKLDGKIKLIDSPGIVFASKDGASGAGNAGLILLNAIPPKEIQDPVPAISLLLSRLSALSDQMPTAAQAVPAPPAPLDTMLSFYGIPALMTTTGANGVKDITTDFLVQVARKRGRLGKGGVPNLSAAAFTVITDWRDGRIQGWVEAPKLAFNVLENGDVDMNGTDDSKSSATGSVPDQKKIVTEWSAEFKLEGLWGNNDGGDEPDAETADMVVDALH